MLQPELFQRLFLFWNTSVRGYFQRLVVWRLSRLGQTSSGRPPSTKDPWIFQALQTLNFRLEAIRNRHNELDPIDDLPDDDLFDEHRASISSTRGVADQPWAVEELIFAGSSASHGSKKANRRSTVYGSAAYGEWGRLAGEDERIGGSGGAKAASKVVNWLKITLNSASGRGKGAKGMRAQEAVIATRIDPFALDVTAPSETVNVTQPSPRGRGQEDDAMLYPDMPLPPVHETAEVAAIPSHANPGAPAETIPSAISEDREDEAGDSMYTEPVSGAPVDSAFFKFEFETDTPRSDNFDARKSAHGSIKEGQASDGDDADTIYPGILSPTRRPPSMAVSPRVS